MDKEVKIKCSAVKYVFNLHKEFKEWVEQTSLFNSLVKNSGNPNCEGIEAIDGSFIFNTKGITVKTVYDLPWEVVLEFWKNYKLIKTYRL